MINHGVNKQGVCLSHPTSSCFLETPALLSRHSPEDGFSPCWPAQPEISVNPQSKDAVWVLRMGVAHPKLLVLLKSHIQIQI